MGVTGFSLDLLKKHNLDKKDLNVLELGCQNIYNQENYGEISNDYFSGKGQHITSIDLEGCNGSDVVNLDKPIDKKYINKFDVVTNFGTSEHCGDLFQTFKNMYNACKVGGVIICENPKIGNWKGHGNHYMTTFFYHEFCGEMEMEVLDLGEHPAMGNTKDGWNVYCVFKKSVDNPFYLRVNFELLPYKDA